MNFQTKQAPTQTLSIAVFGAAGDVGMRIVAEAAARTHRVTAVSRREAKPSTFAAEVTTVLRDVTTAKDLRHIAEQHDIVVSSLRPPDGMEPMLVDLTAAVVEAAIAARTRFIVVGGAASLRLPDDPAHTVLTAPDFLPPSVIPIASACQAQHDWLLPRLGTLGASICPPAMLTPGVRTGAYRVGGDTLVADESGDSHISMEDFAVAILDEAEHPRHTGRRFTVGA